MAPTKNAQRLRRAAERKGKAEDQYEVGCLLYHGEEGLKQDRVAAVKWCSKAAAQQHAGALGYLGLCYVGGEGVEQNYALAATWFSKAADQGHAKAQGYLGYLHLEGKGVEQDNALAVAWWEKGAVGGDAVSQFNLGRGYTHGEYGLPKNAHCAKIYMMAAADQEYPGQAEAIELLKELRACAACGVPDAPRACQGCRTATGLSTARYCNPACQAAHWKAHEPDCGPSLPVPPLQVERRSLTGVNARRPRRNPLHRRARDNPLYRPAAAHKQPHNEITTTMTRALKCLQGCGGRQAYECHGRQSDRGGSGASAGGRGLATSRTGRTAN
jgi:hypothetical protein